MAITRKKYLILQFTWGLFGNLIGGFLYLLCKLAKFPSKKFRNAIEVVVPWTGAAASIGMFIFRGPDGDYDALLLHEYGHTLQNIKYGPFSIILVQIPSVIRFWYRELRYYRRGRFPNTPYDNVWFEEEATRLGFLAQGKEIN